MVTRFHETAGDAHLSYLCNAAEAKHPIHYKKRLFASAEHAIQSDRFCKRDRNRFSLSGDLGTLSENSVQLLFGNKVTLEDFEARWCRKGRARMIGQIAKKASEPEVAKRLGLKFRRKCKLSGTEEEILIWWYPILYQKFKDDYSKQLILSTGGSYLVNFSPFYNSDKFRGNVENGDVVGTNLTGRVLMYVKKGLCSRYSSNVHTDGPKSG